MELLRYLADSHFAASFISHPARIRPKSLQPFMNLDNNDDDDNDDEDNEYDDDDKDDDDISL